MREDTLQDLRTSLQDAKIREREAQNKYETAKYKRAALEAAISIMQGRSLDNR